MIIKLLYVALVLCVAALVVVAAAGYRRVKNHLQTPTPPETSGSPQQEQKQL